MVIRPDTMFIAIILTAFSAFVHSLDAMPATVVSLTYTLIVVIMITIPILCSISNTTNFWTGRATEQPSSKRLDHSSNGPKARGNDHISGQVPASSQTAQQYLIRGTCLLKSCVNATVLHLLRSLDIQGGIINSSIETSQPLTFSLGRVSFSIKPAMLISYARGSTSRPLDPKTSSIHLCTHTDDGRPVSSAGVDLRITLCQALRVAAFSCHVKVVVHIKMSYQYRCLPDTA
jgi:hypothetical protein